MDHKVKKKIRVHSCSFVAEVLLGFIATRKLGLEFRFQAVIDDSAN